GVLQSGIQLSVSSGFFFKSIDKPIPCLPIRPANPPWRKELCPGGRNGSICSFSGPTSSLVTKLDFKYRFLIILVYMRKIILKIIDKVIDGPFSNDQVIESI